MVERFTYRVVRSHAEHKDHRYVARCIEYPALSSLGDTPQQALDRIVGLVSDTVGTQRAAREPEEPSVESMRLPMSSTLRTRLSREAAERGMGLIEWAVLKLSLDAGRAAIAPPNVVPKWR